MDPELETLEASFNNRIEQWLSKQGLLFQFTHNTGSGLIFPKICGLLFRLLIIAVIALAICWFYLSSRPNSEVFKEDVQQQLVKGLNASEVEILNISRVKGGLLTGEMIISSIAMGESEGSFFEDWYMKEENVSLVGRRSVTQTKKTATFDGVQFLPLGIGDNYFSGWSGKELNILKMELKLKTGAASDELAMTAYSSLFKEYESLNIDTIQIFDANLMWGYTENSTGSIKGAQFKIIRGIDSWEINVSGGTFSHGWLKNAPINKMKVICKSSGEVVVESASFNIGDGELKLNASIQIKSQPEVTGNYSFVNVGVIDLIGDRYEKWLDGNIGGTGEISGKLNSAEGLKVITTVNLYRKSKYRSAANASPDTKELENDSVLIIRGDNFELLKILQMKDSLNSYSLMRAHKGTLIIENQGADTQVTVNNVRCGSNDLMLMQGEFKYLLSVKSPNEVIDTSTLEIKENEMNPGVDQPENNGLETTVGMERSFSGEINLGLTPEVFENNINALNIYPIDKPTLRVWINVKLNGQLESLTEELADELFDIMEEGENN
jgi:hypothetical protein